MIATRTLVSAGIAGLGTLVGGAMAERAPEPGWGKPVEAQRPLAAAIAMGSMMGGITGAITGPGTSLKPLLGVLGAGLGGLLVGQHVIAPLFDR